MTGLTKMGVTPAEPLGNRATKSTFKFNIVLPMLLAFFEIDSTDVRAFCTYQFLGLEFLIVLGLRSEIFTALLSTKVRRLAFEAHIVGVYSHGVFLGFLVVSVTWLGESFIFMSILMLQSLQRHIHHLVNQLLQFSHIIIQRNPLSKLYPDLTQLAIAEVEEYSWREPLCLNSFLNALVVEDMSALKFNTWRLNETLRKADVTEIVACLEF